MEGLVFSGRSGSGLPSEIIDKIGQLHQAIEKHGLNKYPDEE